MKVNIIMHQLKSSYNTPFKDSYSHPFTPVLRWLLVMNKLAGYTDTFVQLITSYIVSLLHFSALYHSKDAAGRYECMDPLFLVQHIWNNRISHSICDIWKDDTPIDWSGMGIYDWSLFWKRPICGGNNGRSTDGITDDSISSTWIPNSILFCRPVYFLLWMLHSIGINDEISGSWAGGFVSGFGATAKSLRPRDRQKTWEWFQPRKNRTPWFPLNLHTLYRLLRTKSMIYKHPSSSVN